MSEPYEMNYFSSESNTNSSDTNRSKLDPSKGERKRTLGGVNG